MNWIAFKSKITPKTNAIAFNEIEVPREIVKHFGATSGPIRVLCSVKDGEVFPCALNPRKTGNHVIIASKDLIKRHLILADEELTLRVAEDPDDGLQAPEEFSEALALDDWGCQLFEALRPGRQRGLLYYIRSAKSVDTRIKRSFEIIEKLKHEAVVAGRKKS